MEEQTPQGPGVLSIVQVLFVPGGVFDRIAARPAVLPALIALMLSGLVVAGAMALRIDFEEQLVSQTEKELAKNPQTANMSEEDRAEALVAVRGIAKAMPVIMVGGVLVLQPLMYLFVTALFWVLFKLVAGSDWDFKTALSATLHGFAPALAGSLVMLVLLAVGDPATFDTQEPIKSHLGALVDKEEVGAFVYALLQSLEFFSFWMLTLLVIGYRRTARVTQASAAGIVIATFAVWVLGKSLVMMALATLQAGAGA